MNNRSFLFLTPLIGLCFICSANAGAATPMTKETLRDSSEFVVKEDWIACYKDKNGAPTDDIVEIFYSGDHIVPQQWQHWAPYTEYDNQLYLWVKYNDTPAVGCFVEATSDSLSAVETASIGNATSNDNDTATTKNTEETPPVKTTTAKNKTPENGTPIKNVPLVSSASTKTPTAPAPASKLDKDLKINCVAPGTTATRRLETSYEKYPSELPCKVVYFREDGKTQLIAEAKATPGYCTEKRNEFLDKLKGWGWQCSSQ